MFKILCRHIIFDADQFYQLGVLSLKNNYAASKIEYFFHYTMLMNYSLFQLLTFCFGFLLIHTMKFIVNT